ncbi:hypothetical protein [Flavobacterium flavipallidum]|uniref:CarboxypepD_reg-like domain-containing protein n=1 Tax=Flavobacterium flavipallidum TaxID=3139140 RepID=A0ABU9HR25_9FLAO
MRKFIVAFLILFVVVSFGQNNTSNDLKGKVNAYVSNLEGIYVINLKTEQTVFTNEVGDFEIKASAGDTLVFSGLQFKRKEVVLCPEDFEGKVLNVHLVAVVHELNEVLVRNYNNINAVSLRIVSPNIRTYTPAERKYATAASYKMNPLGLDPVLNLISGRTAMLKKEIAVEKKESYMALLEKMFGKEHFINTLHLPVDYINGFKFYVVDNQKFTKILDTKNKTSIEFLLGELAVKYKEIIAVENK